MGELIGRPNFNWNSRDFRTRKSSFLKNKKPFGDYFVEKDEETSISRHDSNSLFFFQGCSKGKGWNHKRRESAFRYFCKNYQNKSVYVFKILSQTQQHNFSLSLLSRCRVVRTRNKHSKHFSACRSWGDDVSCFSRCFIGKERSERIRPFLLHAQRSFYAH